MKILIEEMCDGFSITVDGKEWHFDQEDTKEGLVEMFEYMGIKDVQYEEIY